MVTESRADDGFQGIPTVVKPRAADKPLNAEQRRRLAAAVSRMARRERKAEAQAASRWVHEYFFRRVQKAATRRNVPIGAILKPGCKDRRAVLARRDVVLHMRTHVGHRPAPGLPLASSPLELLGPAVLAPAGGPPVGGVVPISFPELALHTGCNHSTLVLIWNKWREEKMANRAKIPKGEL